MKKILLVKLAALALLAGCGDKSSSNGPDSQSGKAIYGTWKFRKTVGSLDTLQVSVFVRIKEGTFEVISQCENNKDRIRALAVSAASIESNKVTILEDAKSESAGNGLKCRASMMKSVLEYEINKEVLTFKNDGKEESLDRATLPAL